MADNEKYKLTPCAATVIRSYDVPATNQGFAEAQRTIGAELIRCHFEAMSPRARWRAVRTIAWLDRGGRDYCNSFLQPSKSADFWSLSDETP